MDLGVIVAGGAGRRLEAGVPKAQVMLAGKTLLERAAAVLAGVCSPIVVVTPLERRPKPAPLGVQRWIEDAPGGEGPLAGIVAGLSAERYDRAIVLGVDFPFVQPALLRVLLDELDRSRAAAVIPAPGGIGQPLVAAYAPRAASALREAFERGERSALEAAARLEPLVLDDARLASLDPGGDSFFNLNTPKDLEAAQRRLAERASRRKGLRRAPRGTLAWRFR